MCLLGLIPIALFTVVPAANLYLLSIEPYNIIYWITLVMYSLGCASALLWTQYEDNVLRTLGVVLFLAQGSLMSTQWTMELHDLTQNIILAYLLSTALHTITLFFIQNPKKPVTNKPVTKESLTKELLQV